MDWGVQGAQPPVLRRDFLGFFAMNDTDRTRRSGVVVEKVSVPPVRLHLPEPVRSRTHRARGKASKGRHDDVQCPPTVLAFWRRAAVL